MKATESYWPDPIRHREAIDKLGEELAHDVASIFTATNLSELAAQFSFFWSGGGLGTMKIVQSEPLLIEVKNCYDCAGWKMNASITACIFKKKFMKTVFEDMLSKSVRIEEIECCRRPAPACLFSVIA